MTESEGNKIRFKGRYDRVIKDGAISLPEAFLPFLNQDIRLIAIEKKLLLLFPEDDWKKKKRKEELREFVSLNPDTKISYLGITRLKKRGRLAISLDTRKLTGFDELEVVIIGMVDSVEIWARKRWAKEMEKYAKEHKRIDKEIMKIFGEDSSRE